MSSSPMCNCTDPEKEAIIEKVVRVLKALGYSDKEIELFHEFPMEFEREKEILQVEVLISLEGKAVILVKCINGFLVTWERATIAMARFLFEYTVPLAVVVNNSNAVVVDTSTGKAIGNSLEAIPSRNEMEILVKNSDFSGITVERREGEKRILFTFPTSCAARKSASTSEDISLPPASHPSRNT